MRYITLTDPSEEAIENARQHPGFAAYAQERREQYPHESERHVEIAWTRELEARRRREAERLRYFPARALEVARAASDTQPVRDVRAWSRVNRDGILVLAGPKGTGKTVAATVWALEQSFQPVFMRAAAFASSSRYDRESRQLWEGAHGLVLDDLGAEYSDAKGSFVADLDELVDVFYAAKRTLLITTNLLPDDFRRRYGERIVDRFAECGTWITCTGPSLRGRGHEAR